jgi:hypothetical protein
VTPWKEWPEEERLLFNPAFIAAVLMYCAKAYSEQTGQSLPLPIAVIGTVLALSPGFREDRPRTTRTVLSAWLNEHPEQRIRLSQRAPYFVDAVRQGVLFGCRHGALQVSRDAGLVVGNLKRGKIDEETMSILKTAEFIGRWFGMTGTPATVMALWGVAP